ncbi:MAG: 6-carboxytetrahydropterin synthase QueD [Candidatus Cloacimonetes bacterium]|nr:6-carboxytetrahydropterin synthase QueD [Candidatus Cloacimonadota bacterium]NLK49564.1 6-carboxytetrahydropterin synthase QueD [Candidatus Cloacimonadota bacterium]NLO12257.1 6-carboxytetrahydropterin synthase QueD [Candidatus Cloacimonadota bacterium]
MYRLSVSDSFSAAHKLCGYEGACRNLHGHNWKVKVCLASQELDGIGMALDFGVIKELLTKILDELDHAYLNDLPAFKDQNPTSENLARYIFERFEKEFADTKIKTESVEIQESERSSVVYSHA